MLMYHLQTVVESNDSLRIKFKLHVRALVATEGTNLDIADFCRCA